MHSIRVKIMAVTMAAVLTSILALGGIGVLTIGVESDRSSAEKMRLLCENMQQELDGFLNSIRQSVNMAIHMAGDSLTDPGLVPLDDSAAPEEVAKLDRAVKAHCDVVEHAFASIASNTSGIVTYYYCINCDYGSNEHGFFWWKEDGEAFVEQPPLISTDLDPADIEHTTWYYSPLKAGRPVWIGPYRAHYLGEAWTVSYVAPIYHQGFLLGVLGMDILFDTMIERLGAVKLYDTGYAFLMDRDGNVIYHPDMQLGGVPIVLSQELDGKLMRRRSTGDELVRYERNGKQWQLAFATLSDDHKVGVTVPVSEINASHRQLTLFLLLVALAILGLFTVVTLLLMNALTKPLLRLTSASQKLMNGDYDVALDYSGKDEVGILTQSFCHMRDHLKTHISDLNARVNTDAMTGVKNKGAFESFADRLDDIIRLGERQSLPAFSVIVFDCNNLKHINDEYGHACGDIYLRAACRLICRVFAHSPVFRMGGDEFTVILQRQDYEHRDELLTTFDRMVAEQNAAATQPWERIGVSRGMAVFEPASDTCVGQVLQRADEAMYANKRQQKSAAQ